LRCWTIKLLRWVSKSFVKNCQHFLILCFPSQHLQNKPVKLPKIYAFVFCLQNWYTITDGERWPPRSEVVFIGSLSDIKVMFFQGGHR
jgi:hypothetical protein